MTPTKRTASASRPFSGFYVRVGKRAFDIAVSLFGLILFSPLLALIGLVSWGFIGRPVLFKQIRPGLNERTFTLVKFRTMRDMRKPDGQPQSDDVRLTRYGQLLRATSLDELPELWNVLRGDMSLIGPRPLLVDYLPLYSPEQARRHTTRPGITGLAQVSGRNTVSWPERFALDVWYVDHLSFRVDLGILGKTVTSVLLRDGITAKGQATAAPFEGANGSSTPPST